MAKLEWDKTGEKLYHLGVSKMVLFPWAKNAYGKGVAWNGITGVTASPDGGDATELYADNGQYGAIRAAEKFGMTIKAYMYPVEWAECDGSAEIAPGVYMGQQKRKPFACTWQSLIGSDANGEEEGYIIHLAWGATAKPSDQDYETVNDNPDAMEFSWECDTIPVAVPGYRPTAHIEINSMHVDPTKLNQLEDMLYGTDSKESAIPSPTEVLAMFAAA